MIDVLTTGAICLFIGFWVGIFLRMVDGRWIYWLTESNGDYPIG